MRSRVCAQLAGELGIPGAGAGSGPAAARPADNTNAERNNAVRDMPILRLNEFIARVRTGQKSYGSWLVLPLTQAAGFHAKSSCLAARTSSSRRTGIVCGAEV